MKNFKKILIVILAATLLFATCMVAAFADGEYTGTVEELTKLVDKAEKATGASKQAAIIAAYDYYGANTFNPEEEGYEDIIGRTHDLIMSGIESNLAFASAATIDSETAYVNIFNAKELFGLADKYLAEDYEGLADAKAKYDDALLKAANALLAKVDKDILTTLNTATNKVAINKVRRVLTDGNPFGDASILYDVWGNLVPLEELHEQEKSLIIISHQERILNIADEIIVIADGSLKSQGTKAEILPELLNGTGSCKFYQEVTKGQD